MTFRKKGSGTLDKEEGSGKKKGKAGHQEQLTSECKRRGGEK